MNKEEFIQDMKSLLQTFWNTKWALSISAGILLGLGFPPFPFPFFTFIAFFLLFRLIDLADSAKSAAYWSYPAFVIWNIIGTYWLVMATIAGGIAAIVANAAVMTIPVMLQYLAQKYFRRWQIIALLQSAFWISYEYLHHQWDLAWPWLALGNAWSNVPELVQYISVTGYLGISLWVVVVSAVGYQAWKRSNKTATYCSIGIAFLLPILSLVQLSFVETESSESADIVVAQPNFDSYQEYGGFDTAQKAMAMLAGISDSVRTDQTDLIIWPENGIHPALHSLPVNDTPDKIKSRILSLASQWEATISGGSTYFEYYNQQNMPRLARHIGNRPYLYYNSALAFYPDSTLKIYRKYNLVPIVERIPFVSTLNAVDIFDWVRWRDMQGYGKGSNPDQFPIAEAETLTPGLVCYDSVFPGWVRKFVNDGAGFITVITNDGWWGNTSGHIQHFAYARLRALEFRRWIVRSANNGISGIIAPDGSIKIKTGYWERTAFRYEVPILKQQTIYARFGDWLPYTLLLFSIAGLTSILYRKVVSPNN